MGHSRSRRFAIFCCSSKLRASMKDHADEQRRRQDRAINDAARHGEDFEALALTPDNRLTDAWRFD